LFTTSEGNYSNL